MKILTFTFLSIIGTTVLLFACESKECRDAPSQYVLEIPVSIYPNRDTFRIGDTIQITSEFSDEIYDRSSKRFYKIKNQDFYPRTYIVRIDTNPAYFILEEFDWLIGEEFDYEPVTASDMSKVYSGEFNYSETSGTYELSFGFIPQQPGMYLFRHTTRVSLSVSSIPDIPGLCDRKDIAMHSKLNLEEESNIELLQDSPDEFYNTFLFQRPDEFHRAAGFVFVVTE